MSLTRRTASAVARLAAWKGGLLLMAVALMAGCETPSHRPIQVRPVASPPALPTKASHITLPIVVKLDALRKAAEGLVPETYNVSFTETSQGIKADAELELRRGPMQVSSEGDRLSFRTVWDGAVNGSAKFGVIELAPVGLRLATEFASDISLTTNLQLHTETTAKGEVLSIQPRGFPVERVPVIGKWIRAKVADERLMPRLEEKAQGLDAQITNDRSIKEGLDGLLRQLSTGVALPTSPEVWLQVRPVQLRVGQVRFVNNELVCQCGLDATITASLSQPPAAAPLAPIPVVKDDTRAKRFVVNTTLRAGYPEWTAFVRPKVIGFQHEVGAGTKVEITDAQLSNSGPAVAVRLEMQPRGRVNAKATVVLNGVPRFDTTRKEVFLEGLDFDLQTKHLPVKLADLFLHEWVRKRVSETARYSLAGDLASYQAIANAAGRTWEPLPGTTLHAVLNQLEVSGLQVEPEGVAIALLLGGRAEFKVRSLNL